jgi:hypothetical protein
MRLHSAFVNAFTVVGAIYGLPQSLCGWKRLADLFYKRCLSLQLRNTSRMASARQNSLQLKRMVV